MPKRNIPSGEINYFTIDRNEEKDERSYSLAKRLIGGAAIVGALGLGLGVGSSEAGGPAAKADVCYVVGGAGDGSGEGARGVLADQGRLNGCNEGVQTIPYTGDFWPSSGALQERDAIPPAIFDLTNRLDNSAPWQHKVVFGFSEGSQVAAQALADTNGTNIDFDLIGNPNIRTGMFNSFLYNGVPLVRPIAELIGVDDSQPAPRPRPGISVEAEYSKGDMFANAEPQGIDPFSLISGADMMARMGAHHIPGLYEPVIADFYDADGVRHIVRDDGSPFTRTGDHDPNVMTGAAEFPPFFYGTQPFAIGPPPSAANFTSHIRTADVAPAPADTPVTSANTNSAAAPRVTESFVAVPQTVAAPSHSTVVEKPSVAPLRGNASVVKTGKATVTSHVNLSFKPTTLAKSSSRK
jgi:hypothetical protein